jgi:hypothetical protein
MFLGNCPKKVFEEFSNDEIDVVMEDYVDEGLFLDIYDFKSRNDCLLRYDVFDKLKDIKAKSLIMGSSDYLYFNNDVDQPTYWNDGSDSDKENIDFQTGEDDTSYPGGDLAD